MISRKTGVSTGWVDHSCRDGDYWIWVDLMMEFWLKRYNLREEKQVSKLSPPGELGLNST
jgi:hypothetical protein